MFLPGPVPPLICDTMDRPETTQWSPLQKDGLPERVRKVDQKDEGRVSSGLGVVVSSRSDRVVPVTLSSVDFPFDYSCFRSDNVLVPGPRTNGGP